MLIEICQYQLKSSGKMHYQISKFVQFYYSFSRGKGWFIQVPWFHRFRWKLGL